MLMTTQGDVTLVRLSWESEPLNYGGTTRAEARAYMKSVHGKEGELERLKKADGNRGAIPKAPADKKERKVADKAAHKERKAAERPTENTALGSDKR